MPDQAQQRVLCHPESVFVPAVYIARKENSYVLMAALAEKSGQFFGTLAVPDTCCRVSVPSTLDSVQLSGNYLGNRTQHCDPEVISEEWIRPAIRYAIPLLGSDMMVK